jgi:hypothetical protein
MELKVWLGRVDADTLLAEQINQERAGLIVPLGESGLVVLVLLNVLDVLIEEVR